LGQGRKNPGRELFFPNLISTPQLEGLFRNPPGTLYILEAPLFGWAPGLWGDTRAGSPGGSLNLGGTDLYYPPFFGAGFFLPQRDFPGEEPFFPRTRFLFFRAPQQFVGAPGGFQNPPLFFVPPRFLRQTRVVYSRRLTNNGGLWDAGVEPIFPRGGACLTLVSSPLGKGGSPPLLVKQTLRRFPPLGGGEPPTSL